MLGQQGKRSVLQVPESNILYFFSLPIDPLHHVENIQLMIVALAVPFDLKPTDCIHFHNELRG